MADLDVTDILYDPDFTDDIIVKRNVQTIGQDGIAVNTPTEFTPIAVVTIGPVKGLNRTDAYQIDQVIITVHTPEFRLIGPQPGMSPDTVNWGGDDYVVVKQYNWSHFGAGFTCAECELQAPVTTS